MDREDAMFEEEVDGDADWEAEVRGLGYMILTIASRYEAARTTAKPSRKSRKKWRLGGDDELLWSAVMQAKAYCEGPLAERLGPPPSVWCLFWVDEHRNERLSQIFTTEEEAERVAVEHPEGLPDAFVQSWAVHDHDLRAEGTGSE